MVLSPPSREPVALERHGSVQDPTDTRMDVEIYIFGTNARKRRGLSMMILRIVFSSTPAYISFGTKSWRIDDRPAPQLVLS
jgi:hypothetical protein